MINFHFPPIAASAAVSGHPPTGLARLGPVELPEGAFLMTLIGRIIVPSDLASDLSNPRVVTETMVTATALEELNHDSRSPKLQNQAWPPRRVHPILRDALHTGAALTRDESCRPVPRPREP